MLKTVKIFSLGLFLTLCPATMLQALPVKTGVMHDFSELNQGQSARQTFDNLIKNNNVVVDFYAHWCGPCKQMKPIFQALAQDFTNVIFVKLNIEDYADIASAYNIRSIPSFLFFQQGNLIKRTTGSTTKAKLAATLSTLYPR